MAGIKDAAVRLFASRGYANTSLEDVASAAGFTKGAVYYYFKSKERLLLNVMQDIEGRSIDKTVAAVHSRDGAVLEKMLEFSTLHGRWAAEAPDDLAILMLMSIETAKAKAKNGIRKRVLAFYSKMEDLLTEVKGAWRAACWLLDGRGGDEDDRTPRRQHAPLVSERLRRNGGPNVDGVSTAYAGRTLREIVALTQA